MSMRPDELKALTPGSKYPTMTVGQLIDMLKALPLDAPLMSEGCDCYGPVVSLDVQDDGMVLLERGDE